MKNPGWSPALWSIGLAALAAAACIDTSSLKQPSGAGGTAGTIPAAGRGGTTGHAGTGGAPGVGGRGAAGSPSCDSPVGVYDRCEGACGCAGFQSPVVYGNFVINECGSGSAAFINGSVVTAIEWDESATLSADGITLQWQDGSVWVRTCSSGPHGVFLVPDAAGMFDGSNAAGVVGAWWSTGDLYDGDNSPGSGTCPMAGFPRESCSVLQTPTPGAPFRPDSRGRGMCTAGVAAEIVNGTDGQPAYSSIWGNIIGFSLAYDASLDAGIDGLGVYDAPAHGITGFAFDIDAVPPGGHIRVTFPTRDTLKNAAYWQGAMSDLSPVTIPGHYEMHWPEIGGPMYLSGAPAFDPTTLEEISFHVVSNLDGPIPYSFCINNVTLLTN